MLDSVAGQGVDRRRGRHQHPSAAARVHVLILLAALTTGASAGFARTTMQPGAAGPPAAESNLELVTVQPAPPPGPRPTRIDIPAIKVSADLEELHRGFDGELTTPTARDDAGWYAEGAVPGQRGPAVIAGHLDSEADRPAVFYRLPLLRAGDEVFVASSDGARQRFVVDGTRKFAKAEFPTELVYGPTALAEIRLVTCTGAFDPDARSYNDNLLVTAHAV